VVDLDRILGAEGLQKMLLSGFGLVLDCKVIYHQGEHCPVGLVTEEACNVRLLNIIMLRHVGNESLLGQVASLLEAIHAHINLDKDISVVYKRTPPEFVEYGIRQVLDGNLDVLWLI
jgi:hypothetical protein